MCDWEWPTRSSNTERSESRWFAFHDGPQCLLVFLVVVFVLPILLQPKEPANGKKGKVVTESSQNRIVLLRAATSSHIRRMLKYDKFCTGFMNRAVRTPVMTCGRVQPTFKLASVFRFSVPNLGNKLLDTQR
jgi:hypothetical protein